MIVVSDTSPLITLHNLGVLWILPRLHGEIVVPEQVWVELDNEDHLESGRSIQAEAGNWARRISTVIPDPIAALDLGYGESAAIVLAEELGAELLLIDDKAGRQAARSRKLSTKGTIGILEDAAFRGWIDLADAFESLKQSKFRVSPVFLDARLARFQLLAEPFIGGGQPGRSTDG